MKKTFKNIFGFKAFSVLLSLSLLFGALWCVPAFAEDEGTKVNVWNGESAEFTEGDGSGTKEDPYKISNGGQLFKMMTSQGKNADDKALYYTIKNDIYLNDVDNGVYTNDWVNNESVNDNYRFIGNVDGNGNTIYGLYASNGNKSRMGLFPYLGEGAVIRNIRISDSSLNSTAASTSYIGAIVGQIAGNNVEISGCAVENTTVSAKTETSVVAGIIGNAYGHKGLKITNCGFNGTLKKNGSVITAGGIVAQNWNNPANISNCYSKGAFPVFANNANNIQKAYTCTNVYTNISAEESNIKTDITEYKTSTSVKTKVDGYATVLSVDEMRGANAKVKMTGFDFYTAWQAVENDYPVPRTTDCAEYTGKGTKENPYVISTDAQLYRLATDKDTKDKYYMLENDIVLNSTGTEGWYNTASQWVTAGDYTTTVFRGNLDGNGKTVRGLYVNTSGDGHKYAGLFPVIGAGAVISKLTVKDTYLYGKNNSGDYFFGAIAGAVNLSNEDKENTFAYPTILACGVENADVNARYVGGILGGGAGKARIESSYSANLNLSNDAYTGTGGETAGGIIGKNWVPSSFFVKNCYTTHGKAYEIENNKGYSVVQNNVISGVQVATNGTTSVPSELFGGTFKTVENSVPVPDTESVTFIKVDTVNNKDSLTAIRNYLLGDRNIYIVDVNNDVTFDICDLVYAASGK